MKLYYDLHIHSALSPCGDNDMTPNNIVNMARLKGLSVIALCDHNTAGNARAVMNVAKEELLVVPAIEVTTSEEVHALCYFADIDAAEDMSGFLYGHLPDIDNRPDIFGHQYYMDENDEITGEEKKLLVSATDIDIYRLAEEAKRRGGIMVPAHIDRSSYSVLANLGFLPPDLPVRTLEITKANADAMKNDYAAYRIITDSDAHYLEDIAEPERELDILNKTREEIVKYLCNF